jgi:hypothetical protein
LRNGEEQASVLGNALWLAPLSEEIRGALTGEIATKLHAATVRAPATTMPASIVTVTITRFESVPARYVTVAANWRIRRADLPPSAVFACETSTQWPIEGGVSAVVQGYQKALVSVADEIAADISRLGSDLEPTCAIN